MPPDQGQNINLLPGDLKRKREVIKKVIADDSVAYTQPQNSQAKKTSTPKPNGRPSLSPPKPDFLRQSSGSTKEQFKDFEKRKKEKEEKKQEPAATSDVRGRKISWWQRLFARKTSPDSEKVKIPMPAVWSPPTAPDKKLKLPTVTSSAPLKKEEPVPEKELEPVVVKSTPEPQPQKTPPPPISKPSIAKEPELPSQTKPASASSEFDVNLLSKEYAEVFKVKNQKSVLISWVIASVVAVIFAYIGIHLYQLKKSANIRNTSQINIELEKTIATYSSLEQEDAVLLQKISSLKTLFGSHISLNKFLNLLEKATIPEVTYTAIAASREGLVTISALATDYTSVGRQLSILQEHTDWVKEAQVSSAQLSKDNQAKTRGVGFDLLLKVDKSVFSQDGLTP